MRHLLIITLLLIGITACDAPVLSDFMPIRFTEIKPIHMDVSEINIEQEYQSSKRPPHVEHLLPVPLTTTIAQWAHDRIHPTPGSDKSMLLIVKHAGMVEKTLPVTKGIRGWFTDDQQQEYTARIVVELRIYGARAVSLVSSNIHANRSITINEGASLAERDEIFYKLIQDLMSDLDTELEKHIHQHFADYVQP